MTHSEIKNFTRALSNAMENPVLFLDQNLKVISANQLFCNYFNLEEKDILGKLIYNLQEEEWKVPELRTLLERVLKEEDVFFTGEIPFQIDKFGLEFFPIHVGKILWNNRKAPLLKVSFKNDLLRIKRREKDRFYLKSLNKILDYAPAVLCTLKGPDHIYEVANQKYMELLGYRDLIGKSVKEALPEVVSQGILALLDEVYNTGVPYIGKEQELKLDLGGGEWSTTYYDFVYQPTFDALGNVDGIFTFAIDVTQQVLARKEIEDHKNELTTILNTVPSIIWMNDKSGEITFQNESWFEFTGGTREQLRNLGWLDFIHADDREIVKQTFLEANSREEPYSLVYRIKVKNEDYRWVIATGRPKFDKEGNYEGQIGSIVDIHEDKQKEQIIREKERFIRSIVEEATVATAVYTGEEMRIELVNDAMLKVWGKKRTYMGRTFKQALPELEGHHFSDLLTQVFQTGKTYWGRKERIDLLKNKELKKGYFDFSYKPLRNEKGEIYGILNMAIDVTEIVEKENLLRERETHFRQLANFLPDKVTNTNSEGEFIYFNQHWKEYTGLNNEELRLKGWHIFIHPEEMDDFNIKWKESLDAGVEFEKEIRLRNKSGEYEWHLSRAEPVRQENGEIKMWISTNTEIQKLKEEEKRKEDFLKMVSHELKTPVTSINGYVQLLLSLVKKHEDIKLENVPLQPALERVHYQIGRLTRLIAELLDLSRIEENKLKLKKEIFCLNDLVHKTVQDVSFTSTRHKLSISNDFKCMVSADRDRIGQVLINLVNNAIKFSPDGQVIRIFIKKEKDGMVSVSVIDQGIGVNPGDYKNIFKRFYRAIDKNEETYSGFGIGLYLANEIIEKHNGTITVKSNEGKGSNFTFSLPLADKNSEI